MAECRALFKLEGSIREPLIAIEKATALCNERDLNELMLAGYLPTGIYNYLMVLRKVFPDRYGDALVERLEEYT